MGRQEPGAGGSTQLLRVGRGKGLRDPGPRLGPGLHGMCQGGLGEMGAGLGCFAEMQGLGPTLPGVHPPLGTSGLARLGLDGTLLHALHPTLQNCLPGTSLEQSLLWTIVL